MIKITSAILFDENEVVFTFIRSTGPGGQNVNKVATAVQLRFDAAHSKSLPEDVRERLLVLAGQKITGQGELILKATRHRTQERNKHDALNRLVELIKRAAIPKKKRKKTRPTFQSIQNRLSSKKRHAKNKKLRQKKLNTEF